MLQQPFPAAHKYQPAPPQSPFLAVAAPPPASDVVCPCDAQAPRTGPNITFTYAGIVSLLPHHHVNGVPNATLRWDC